MDKNNDKKAQTSQISHQRTNDVVNEEMDSGIEVRDLRDLFARSIPEINKGKLSRSESCI